MISLAYALGSNPGTSEGTQSPLSLFLPFIIIFVIFYFLLIRPQKNQQKKHHEMVNNLKKNDKVITSGGVYGTVLRVKETSLVLKVDDNTKLEIQKSSISRIIEQ